MLKHWILAFAVLGFILGGALAAAINLKENVADNEVVHFHAGFQVYVDNELQNFSDLSYMKLDPCGDEHAVTASLEDEQLERAHLHNFNGDVLHVHRAGATWGDLFQNINYVLPTGELVVYVDGQLVEGDILTMNIHPNSSAMFFLGTNEGLQDKLKTAITQARIFEVEQLSENCGEE